LSENKHEGNTVTCQQNAGCGNRGRGGTHLTWTAVKGGRREREPGKGGQGTRQRREGTMAGPKFIRHGKGKKGGL